MAALELSRDRGKTKRSLGIPIKKNFFLDYARLPKGHELKDDPKIEPEQKDKIKEASVKINDIYVKYYIEYIDKLVEKTQFENALSDLDYIKRNTPFLRPVHKEKLAEKIKKIDEIRLTKKEH